MSKITHGFRHPAQGCRIEALEARRLFDAGDFDPSFNADGIAQFLIAAGAVQTTDVVVDERDNSTVIVGYTTAVGRVGPSASARSTRSTLS